MDLGDRVIAILVMPTLLDFASTVVSEIGAEVVLVWMLLMPTLHEPRRGVDDGVGVIAPGRDRRRRR